VSELARSRRWFRQPLLWFTLSSAALFAWHARFGAKDTHTIVVPRGLGSESERWKLQQAAQREARELGLWRDDPQALAIARERVAELRARPADEPTDAELGDFLERHRDAFDQPELYTFEQVFLDPRRGDLEARGRAVRAELENGGDPRKLADPFRFPAVLTAEPAARVRAVFGKDFLDALSKAPPGTWQTLRSPDGAHLVRLVKKTAGRRVTVAEARSELTRAYELERAANREREALDAAAHEYRFEDEP
jgi:hypothetical protein